ncbi:MAG: AAA family ATPase, partial [Acidimicrobiales bacterium]
AAPFVGRREELTALRAEARRAFGGELRVVVVEGEGGIGKTTLVHELISHVGAVTCIRTACAEAERDLPWGVVGLLLSSVGPQQRLRSPLHPPQAGTDPLAVDAQLVSGLESLASSGPVVLVVDDLHWADGPSAAALLFALRRLVSRPILTLAAVRPPFPGGLGEGWRRLVVARGRRLRLRGLGTHELAQLAEGLGHEVSLHAATRVRRHTGGHPMWAAALFSDLTTDEIEREDFPSRVPVDIAGTLAARVARLGDAARSLVVAGAVLGSRIATASVAALAGLDDPAQAVQEAVDSGLLEVLASRPETGPVLGFRHSLVRSALYQNLGPARRAKLHAAAVPLTSGSESLGHLAAATLAPCESVAAELEAAGHEASASWQLPLAQLHLDAAVRLSPPGPGRQRRLFSAVEAHLAAGQPVRARAHLAEVTAADAGPRRDYVLGRLARCEGRSADARTYLEQAWHALKGDEDAEPELRAGVAAELASLGLSRMSPDDSVSFARQALAMATPGTPTSHLAGALELVGLALGGRGADAVQSAGTEPPEATPLHLLFGRGVAKLWTDDLPGAHEDLSVTVDRLEAGGVTSQMSPLAFLAEACFRLARMTDASTHAELACEIVDSAERYWDCAVVHT